MFITADELEQQYQMEEMMNSDHLVPQLSLFREVDCGRDVRRILLEEYSSLKQLMPLMDVDISKHLLTIKNALEEESDEVLPKEDIIKAWLCCNEERARLIFGRNTELLLIPPSGLCEIHIFSCSITDRALAICLRGLASLRRLSLVRIMSLTALPAGKTIQHLAKLKELVIDSCWCFRSLGGLRAATSLLSVFIASCPCLVLARGAEHMPLSIEILRLENGIIAADSLSNGFLQLKDLSVYNCRSSKSLSIGHLTSLESLSLYHIPDLCFLEGLPSLQLQSVFLRNVPRLTAKCISQFRVQKSLYSQNAKRHALGRRLFCPNVSLS